MKCSYSACGRYIFSLFDIKMRRVFRQGKITLITCTSLIILLFTSYSHWLDKPWQYSIQQKPLDLDEQDVLVVLHIPRTGMTSLNNLLIKDSIMNKPCTCVGRMTKWKCLNKHNQTWLFHSYNTSGFVCGDFADFTTLTNCPIDHWFTTSGRDTRSLRRYHMITMLREPTARYISEWLDTKDEDKYFFHNEPRLYKNISIEIQKRGYDCFIGAKISTLSLLEFLNCRANPANNRMTRMLANLTAVNSMELSGQEYELALLHSAKQTLLKLPFYGIINRPSDTNTLLEHELGLRFRRMLPHQTTASEEFSSLEPEVYRKLKEVNHLDFKLFHFALSYFDKRLNYIRAGITPKLGDQPFSGGDEDSKILTFDKSQFKKYPISSTGKSNIDTSDHHGAMKRAVQEPPMKVDRTLNEAQNEVEVLDFIAKLELLKEEEKKFSVSTSENIKVSTSSSKPLYGWVNGVRTQLRPRTQLEKTVDRMYM